jgi:hypothetical protein
MLHHFLRTVRKKNIEFVAAATGSTASGTSVTVNKPTGTATGDIMFFVGGSAAGANRNWTQLTGWTEIFDEGNSPSLGIQYRVVDGSEGASFTFTGNFSGNALVAGIATFRNAAYDVIGSIGTASSGGNCTAPQITVTQNNSFLLAAFANQNDTGTFPAPTGMSTAFSSTGAGSCALFYESINSGASGSRSSNPNGSSGEVSGVLFSIKPS